MRDLAGDPGSIRASGAKAGDTAEVRARGKTKIGKKKNVSPRILMCFQHHMRVGMMQFCCQSLFFNWLPCVDHWTVLHWTAEAAAAAAEAASLPFPVSLPIRPDSLASVT